MKLKYKDGGKLKMVEKDGEMVPFFLAEDGGLTRRGRMQRYNTRPGSAYNPEGEFFNPEKQRFARNVKKLNPTQRYNLMRDIQEQRVMRGQDDMDVTDSAIQQRLNRQAIPKLLMKMAAMGLLGKSAADGRFASLIGMGREF